MSDDELYFVAECLEEISDPYCENLGKGKISAKLKDAKEKIKNGIQKVAKAVGNAGKFAVLSPMLPAMKARLKQEGKPVGKGVAEVSQNFYRYIIQRDDLIVAPAKEEELESVAVSVIISAVIAFLKKSVNFVKNKAADPKTQEFVKKAKAGAAAVSAIGSGKGTKGESPEVKAAGSEIMDSVVETPGAGEGKEPMISTPLMIALGLGAVLLIMRK